MNQNTKPLGLREVIAKAETIAVVDACLVIATQYANASAHTERRWLNTAKRRLAQLKCTQKT